MNEHCKTCGEEVSSIRNDSIHSSTYDEQVCFTCLHKKFKDPHNFDFLLTIPPVTELERDVILNGICKNEYFTDYLNGAVWSESVINTCEKTTPAQLYDVMSSLVTKGLVERRNSGGNMTVRLTAEGYFFYLNNRGD
ncbi:hypothetical protein KAU33_04010 [Candidatus Dependentiae bacterium]|nr:hypothetical protein [Candidatus Dependentiae bacterium]